MQEESVFLMSLMRTREPMAYIDRLLVDTYLNKMVLQKERIESSPRLAGQWWMRSTCHCTIGQKHAIQYYTLWIGHLQHWFIMFHHIRNFGGESLQWYIFVCLVVCVAHMFHLRLDIRWMPNWFNAYFLVIKMKEKDTTVMIWVLEEFTLVERLCLMRRVLGTS